jgi:translation initiation factor 1
MYAYLRVMTKKSGHPFESLERLRGQVRIIENPVGETPERKTPSGPARAVVRLERKHRRGKEVTVVEKLALSSRELETWCSELKHALGCGGSVEGDAIVLQGDLRQRLPAVLTKRGVQRVTVSG